MRPKKITLGEAQQQGNTVLLFYCDAATPNGYQGFCRNYGDMSLADALARWGPNLRLDQIPARCTRCGNLEVNVRAYYPHLTSGGLRRAPPDSP